MMWSWTKYADGYTAAIRRNPSWFAFTSALFAFEAGSQLKDLKHTSDVLAHPVFFPAAAVAALLSYFIARTIRQLRDGVCPPNR